MRRIFFVVCFVCQVVILQACGTVKNYTTKPSEYGLWKDSTYRVLQENFAYSLPETKIVYEYGKDYYYKRTQSLLGDENFVIYVVLQFEDKASFEEELGKYTALLSNSILQGDIVHYAIQYSKDAVVEYTNDVILDGMCYNFEIISINEKERSICFVNAHVWDYYKDPMIIGYLGELVA